MILTIDNKLHHLRQLDFIERQLNGVYDPDFFYKDLREFLVNSKAIDLRTKEYLTVPEVEKIDHFIQSYFYARIPEAKTYFLRAYCIGRLLAKLDKQHLATIDFFKTQVESMPKFIQDAVTEFNLSINEAHSLLQAVEKGGQFITNTSTNVQQQIKIALTEAIMRGEGTEGVERRLRGMIIEDAGELNRDMKRVSITETNTAYNSGYIAGLGEGSYVIGISMPDCCPNCDDVINGKVYKVLNTPPPDYSTMEGEAYKGASKAWENCVWPGKTNIGRSSSFQKRIDKRVGNKKDNLTDKKHHEHSMPACPMHPNCRCHFVSFNPRLQWVDHEGNIKLALENREEHRKWYNENIMGYENDIQ